MSLHDPDPRLAAIVFHAAIERMAADPPPLGLSPEPDALPPGTITREGLGGERVMALLRDALLPANTAIDHRRYLAFIPGASTAAASLADLLVSVYAIYGGSWLESAGAVHAESEALRWLVRPGRLPGVGGRHLRPGRDERQPVGAARRARARPPRRPAGGAGGGQRGGPLVGALDAADHGCRHAWRSRGHG